MLCFRKSHFFNIIILKTAEGGYELADIDGLDDVVDQPDDDETTTPFIDIPASESTATHNQEDALEHFTGSSLEA